MLEWFSARIEIRKEGRYNCNGLTGNLPPVEGADPNVGVVLTGESITASSPFLPVSDSVPPDSFNSDSGSNSPTGFNASTSACSCAVTGFLAFVDAVDTVDGVSSTSGTTTPLGAGTTSSSFVTVASDALCSNFGAFNRDGEGEVGGLGGVGVFVLPLIFSPLTIELVADWEFLPLSI